MKQRKKQAEKWGVLVTTLTVSFTVILNNSLMNVALPFFMTYFQLSAVQAQWVVTTFALGMLISMTTTAYLGKKLGYKKVYAIGLSIFLSASLLGALANGFQMIILARLLQGIGGGLVMPLSMMLIFQYFDKSERGFAMGIWGVSAMVAPAIGPTVGGIILHFSSWPTLFLINLPIGIVCFITAFFFLQSKKVAEEEQAFDWFGFMLISVGLITLLLAIEQISHPLHILLPYGLLLLALICIWKFIVHSLSIEQPLLNVRVFKNKIFTASLAVIASSGLAMFSVIFLVPIMLQEVMGETPLFSGLTLFPHAMVVGISMMLGGKILDRRGPMIPLLVGSILIIFISFIFSMSMDVLPIWIMILMLMLYGMGNGFLNTPTVTTALNSLKEESVREGSSIISLLKQIMKVTTVVVFSIVFELRRGIYVAQEYEMYEAGMLAIKDCFLIVCIGFLVIIPFIIYIGRRYEA